VSKSILVFHYVRLYSLEEQQPNTTRNKHCNSLYAVPFLRKAASENGVTLKSELEVIQGQ